MHIQFFLGLQMWTTYFLLWEPTVNYQLGGDLIASTKHNRLTIFSSFQLFNQWYFTLQRQSTCKNEKITEINSGSLSLCLFTRLHPARLLHSSLLARVIQRWAFFTGYRPLGNSEFWIIFPWILMFVEGNI